ncbi:nuclear transport factor 2 family protein [Sphingobium phenoxybenzoativorans]|uniref:Nuclear transport factor 2 family protein n=1 Tax=Sphingobium phenoxybenzoativorans TaxID=1592790 RepID=A0A975Q182_9SPHN|nr:nuclear transport factor 2 family protein [Sphingobium phenoxybenzoativorans]QUT05529.1 nuclear transport factor 2 family protein [Sphingobium phenoxybenzoativorans]
MIAIPLEDRIGLQDLMTAYCYAVDKLDDVAGLLSLFTPDAVLDFTAIGLPLMHGHGEIKAFFDRVFADMSHHSHYISNFRPIRYDGASGAMTAYVVGLGRAKDGNTVEVNVQYTFDAVKTGSGWLCTRYSMFAMMPLPGSLAEIHG